MYMPGRRRTAPGLQDLYLLRPVGLAILWNPRLLASPLEYALAPGVIAIAVKTRLAAAKPVPTKAFPAIAATTPRSRCGQTLPHDRQPAAMRLRRMMKPTADQKLERTTTMLFTTARCSPTSCSTMVDDEEEVEEDPDAYPQAEQLIMLATNAPLWADDRQEHTEPPIGC